MALSGAHTSAEATDIAELVLLNKHSVMHILCCGVWCRHLTATKPERNVMSVTSKL